MDLEKLTKHQIILLTLLVSFVTSIATGIVTVSLMNQAPAGVTRVINQIVERTVEQVVPANQGAAAAGVEKTIVVKDDDLAAQSIAAVQKAIIRIVARGGGELIARGIIVDAGGAALTDRSALAAYGTDNFDAILSSGQRVPAVMRSSDSGGPIATIDILVGTSTGFAPAVFSTLGDLKLGQSVIRIGGGGADTVGVGVIASLPSSGTNTIETSVSSVTPGSVLVTLFGEVIGLTTASSQTLGADFYSVPPAPATSP